MERGKKSKIYILFFKYPRSNTLSFKKTCFRFSNGEVYDGNFNKGELSGSGTLYYPDGSRREGQWINGQLEGIVMYHFNGTDLYKIEQWQNGFKTSDKSISESDVGVM